MNGEIKNCQMIFRLALGLSIFCHDDLKCSITLFINKIFKIFKNNTVQSFCTDLYYVI